jgi:DNA polymerase-3 subunit alpha
MDIPYGEVDRLAKLIPTTLGIELKDALQEAPQLKAAINSDERLKDLMAVALRLEGLSRHASTHAAGVVISPRPLTDVVPVYKTNRDEITTQYDMNALERIGLLKMDFLGLTTLTVLHDAVRMVEQNRGIKIEIDNLALDDAEAYKLFARGETTAIFQFESHGMRDILRRYQPTRIEDLTALNALYRPGPIQGGMIDDFINRKQGKTKVSYELPQLKDILEETYGVILYQEQVMQIANRLANFSLGEADILRRAMGKKKKEEMAAQRAKFMTGCASNKIAEKKAERIFNLMEEFAGYGFNKSHSCAYALLAYQTAYLKTHYPVEFLAALLTSDAGNTEKVVKYINEARGMGISILPPDVNESDLYFTPIGESIRFGLAAIKNVGENTAKAIRESRLGQDEFKSLYDFCERIESRFLNKRVFESLIKSGAVDSLGARESMLASVDDAITAVQRASRTRESGQHGLFGTAAAPAISPFELREAAPWGEEERLASEYAMLGYYVSGHPLAKYSSRLQDLKTISLDQVEEQRNGKEITVGSLIVGTRPMRSKKGARWAIFTIQDMTGVQELLAFPESFARLEQVLKPGNPLLLKVRVQVEEAGTRLSLQEARRLDELADDAGPKEFRVRLEMPSITEEALDRLEDLFTGFPGSCQVVFELCSADGSLAVLPAQQRVKATQELMDEVRRICGESAVAAVGE